MENISIKSLFLFFITFFSVNLQSYAFNNIDDTSQDTTNYEWNTIPVDENYKEKLGEQGDDATNDFYNKSYNESHDKYGQEEEKNGEFVATKDGDKGAKKEVLDEIWDPFETVNRGIFWFNDKADTYFIGPISKGYDYIMPEFAQTGVRNFFSNLTFPVSFVSDLIRFDFPNMATHTSRFLINTVLGIGGLFDVATEMGINDVSTDLGLALNDYGVPAGPYIVLPFIGASNLRDGLSMGAGTYLSPFAIAHYSGVKAGITDKAEWGGAVLDGLQTRVDGEEALKSAKEASVDYYLFMQSAYYQYREGKLKKLRGEINDDNLPSEDNEDEWDF